MNTSSSYEKYLAIGSQPDPNRHVIACYIAKPSPLTRLNGLSFLGAIAAESSTGTWVDVATSNEQSRSVSGKVFEHDPESGITKIAYPLELFEPGNVSQLMTVLAGNAFGLADLAQLRLVDLQVPPAMVSAYKGPAIGRQGIWQMMGYTVDKPVIGAIMKPKVGLTIAEHLDVCYQAWVGVADEGCDGVDMIKDDEASTSQDAVDSNFYKRIEKTLAMKKKAEDKTGNRKVYVPNITHSNFSESLRRAEFVKEHGGEAAMIDYVMSGCCLLQTIREAEFGLILHGHRTLFAALHRSKDFGIDYMVWAKLFRLIGGDQIHSGTPSLGVMSAKKSAVINICDAMSNDLFTPQFDSDMYLPQDFSGIKDVAPICGAGLDPLTTKPLTEVLGSQVIIFAGGGVHGHPDGTAQGAAAMRESVHAILAKETMQDRAARLNSQHLSRAVSFFGSFDKQSPNDGARENL